MKPLRACALSALTVSALTGAGDVAVAAPVNPLKIGSVSPFLAGGSYATFETPTVEVPLTNRSARLVKGASVKLYLTRKANPAPRAQPNATIRVPRLAAHGRSSVNPQLRFSDRLSGRYRLTVCVVTPAMQRRCVVVPGALNVRPKGT